MAWTTIAASDWTDGEIPTASKLNTHIAANLRYLKGADGAFVLDDAVSIGASSTAKTLTVYGNADGGALGPITAQNTSAGTIGTALTLNATGATGGRIYSFLSTANGASLPGAFAIYDGTAFAYRMAISSAGNVAIGGAFSAVGPLHVRGTVGRWAQWDGTVTTTTTIVVPDGTGDVTVGLQLWSIASLSGTPQVANVGGTLFGLSSGNQTLWSSGGNIASFRITAAGQVEVQTTGGSSSYSVSLVLHWI